MHPGVQFHPDGDGLRQLSLLQRFQLLRAVYRRMQLLRGNNRQIGRIKETFQQQDRFQERQLAGRLASALPWAWGFFALQVDEAALLQGRVVVASAHGVLPDGLVFSVPGDDPAPPAFDVPADVRDEVLVLGLPDARPGVPESGRAGPAMPLSRSTIGKRSGAGSPRIEPRTGTLASSARV